MRSGATAAGIADLRRQVQASIFPPGTRRHLQQRRHRRKDRRPDPRHRHRRRRRRDALNEIRDEIIPATIGEVDGASVNVSGDAAASVDFARSAQQQAAADLRVRVRARVPADARHLPLDRDPDQGDPAQPALGRAPPTACWCSSSRTGNGESLLGFTSNGGVANWLPLFLFVILFGLSMDYHVFILSRVRELHDRGMSDRRGRPSRGSRRPRER